MTDRAASIRVKIDRAKEHVSDLETAIKAFYETNPYTIRCERDPDRGDKIYCVAVAAEPPARFGAIAADAIHNFRCSLDHLWCGLMFPDGGGKSKRKGRCFPIHPSADSFHRAYGRHVKPGKQPIVDVLRSIKPYELGNDQLWALHELDNANKHRRLIVAYSGMCRAVLDVGGVSTASEFFEVPPGVEVEYSMCPVDNGAVLCRISNPDHMDMQFQFPVEVAFCEPEILACQPILQTLGEFATLTDGILDDFLPFLR